MTDPVGFFHRRKTDLPPAANGIMESPPEPASRRFIIILFTITCLFMTVLWWRAEYDSCSRANSNRGFMMLVLDTADPERTLPRRGLLDCGLLVPDNGDEPGRIPPLPKE